MMMGGRTGWGGEGHEGGKNDPISAGFGGSLLRAEDGLGPNSYRLAPSGIGWQVPGTIRIKLLSSIR